MSRVRAVELLLVELPLVRPFRTSFGEMREKRCILVRVETDDAEGWGECVADSRPDFSEEFNEGAWLVLRDFLAPSLVPCGRRGRRARRARVRGGPREPDGEGSPARSPSSMRSCARAEPRSHRGSARTRPGRVRREHRDRSVDRGAARAGRAATWSRATGGSSSRSSPGRPRARPRRARGASGHPPLGRRERRVLARRRRRLPLDGRARIS